MEGFLNKYCFIKIDVLGKPFYYTCALISNLSYTHISFKDVTKDIPTTHTYRIQDIIEIKLSNKNPGDIDGE